MTTKQLAEIELRTNSAKPGPSSSRLRDTRSRVGTARR